MSEQPIKRRTELAYVREKWQLFQRESGKFTLLLFFEDRYPLEIEISQEHAFRILAYMTGGARSLHDMEASYKTHPYQKPEKRPESSGDT